METKVSFKVCKIYTRINSESVIGKFEKEEDAKKYAELSKLNEPDYGYKVVKVTEENIFSTEAEEKCE